MKHDKRCGVMCEVCGVCVWCGVCVLDLIVLTICVAFACGCCRRLVPRLSVRCRCFLASFGALSYHLCYIASYQTQKAKVFTANAEDATLVGAGTWAELRLYHPPPPHNYPDRNSELAEIYLRF